MAKSTEENRNPRTASIGKIVTYAQSPRQHQKEANKSDRFRANTSGGARITHGLNWREILKTKQ